ncbi:MAG: hypothetical protein ABFD89_16260, partial [Bryobacteraceae bacterium]
MTLSTLTRRAVVFGPAAALLLRRPVHSAPTPSLAITDVTVIDARGETERGRTVLISGDRIATAGDCASVPIPAGVQILPGSGRFLIPGLWDMHVHLCIAGASALPVLLANGVTGVRDMGGRLAEVDQWRNLIAEGVMAGPRIFRAGPIVNGKVSDPLQIAVESRAEGHGAVSALRTAGVDFVKVHSAVSRDAYMGISEECARGGTRFAGHIPRAIHPREAADAGQSSFEHLYTLFDGVLTNGVEESQLPQRIRRFRESGAEELFAGFARKGSAYTPTIVAEHASLSLQRPQSSELEKYCSRLAKEATRQLQEKYGALITGEYVSRGKRQLEEKLPLIRMMRQAGIELLTGTDLGPSLFVPGFSLH